MVGSSASASCGELSFFCTGLSAGGGISTFGGGNGSWRGNGGGWGGGGAGVAGCGSAATAALGVEGLGVAALGDGRAPVPGMNEKSSASEEEIHGTCSWLE